jgi:hypothetical protein
MLSRQHFYHRITRKLVVAFGTLFNNIRLVRYNKAGTQEIERITVPLSYATKEKFYSRITQDPDLNKEVQLTLPRMSFELTSITYDPLRKNSSFVKQFSPDSSSSVKTSYIAPYNFNFTLNLYVRNTEDGTQIVEQILPFFNPDYTVTINLTDMKPIDVPIILDSINNNMSNDTGSAEELRTIIWTLEFSVKAYLYGPISSGNNAKVIRKVVANTYIDSSDVGEVSRMITFSSGSGTYKIGELVFEGNKLEEANVTAFVKNWDATANNLIIYDTEGVLVAGRKLKGAVSGASYVISTFDVFENQAVMLTVVPNPLTANANDDFGFTTTIEEYPNIT